MTQGSLWVAVLVSLGLVWMWRVMVSRCSLGVAAGSVGMCGGVRAAGTLAASLVPCWEVPMAEERARKLVHHRCGYPLWSQVLGRLEWCASVVVTYRSAVEGASALPVYHCPQCGVVLKLWWDDPVMVVDPSWWDLCPPRHL